MKNHTLSAVLSAITSQHLDSSETHLNTCCLGDSVFWYNVHAHSRGNNFPLPSSKDSHLMYLGCINIVFKQSFQNCLVCEIQLHPHILCF